MNFICETGSQGTPLCWHWMRSMSRFLQGVHLHFGACTVLVGRVCCVLLKYCFVSGRLHMRLISLSGDKKDWKLDFFLSFFSLSSSFLPFCIDFSRKQITKVTYAYNNKVKTVQTGGE